MAKIVRLIVASGETSSNLRYAAGFSAPDEFIWFDDGAGRRGVVMSALEFGRASRSARSQTACDYNTLWNLTPPDFKTPTTAAMS